MKHDRTECCRQCSFRTDSAPGWLGSYTPETVIAHIQKEMPFPCHPTVNYDDPNWRDQVLDPNGKVQQCAGFLIMMRRMAKLPRDPEMAAHAKAVDVKATNVFRSPTEFIAHHSRKRNVA